jgi:hypothetical protein
MLTSELGLKVADLGRKHLALGDVLTLLAAEKLCRFFVSDCTRPPLSMLMKRGKGRQIPLTECQRVYSVGELDCILNRQ